jgi:hypothetical protein
LETTFFSTSCNLHLSQQRKDQVNFAKLSFWSVDENDNLPQNLPITIQSHNNHQQQNFQFNIIEWVFMLWKFNAGNACSTAEIWNIGIYSSILYRETNFNEN